MGIRILHIVTYMGRGGLETMLMNYYRHIDREKIQFDFLVHRDFQSDYDKEILSLGGKIYHISRLIPWSEKYKKELRRFFKSHPEYKVVHVHQDCLSSVALECAKECGVPVRIAHSHNSGQDKNLKYLIKKYYMKKIPVSATDYFACGKMAGDWMFGGQRYHVLKNAIDCRKYVYSSEIREKVRKEYGIKDEVIVGHVGRFNPQKNHKFVIDIFSEIVKIKSDTKLLLIGDGDDREEIEERVKRLGLSENVIFAGVRSDVNELLQAMDVFLFPSLYEGLPVTMIEAQASGIPCVISDTVSQECVITKGLVDIKSLSDTSKAWAQQVLKSAKKMRNDCTEEIRQAGYDVETEVKYLEKYYWEQYEK